MSQQQPPFEQYDFGGLHLAGNPVTRPQGTASICRDIRLMPGDNKWLRLKSGRKARLNLTNALSVHHFINARINASYGNDYALMLVNYGGSVVKMVRLDVSAWTADETGLETIDLSSDSLFYAHAVLSDSVIFDNGKGDFFSGTPTPSLTQWKPASTIRYFGLDCVVAGSIPTPVFTPGGSGINSVTSSVKLYVGTHNVETQHYSNGIYLGTLNSSSGTGEISITGLNTVLYPTHGATETGELRWVFYATIDNFQVPYLIMNTTLDGPFTAAITATSVDLDLISGTVNGWVLDTTKEMPTTNYAPRRMRSICYANGRLYGILSPNFTNTSIIRYKINGNELPTVVWSDADGAIRNRDYLGDPLESWPLLNSTNIPSGERPLVVFPSPNLTEVMVFTATHTFILREQSDGVHDWDTVSNEHGLDPIAWYRVVCRTRHGVVWLTQNKQLAIYTNEGEFKILSQDYDAVLHSSGDALGHICYVYDPKNLLDQVQIYRNYLVSYVHDFNTGAYSNTEPHYVYASSVLTRQATNEPAKHFVIAASSTALSGVGIYTLHGQADESGLERTYDEVYTAASGTNKVTQELPIGLYTGNWNTFGDPNLRKEILYIDVIGDAAVYETVANSGAVLLTYQTGFDNATVAQIVVPQKVTNENAVAPYDNYWRFKIVWKHHWAWKLSLLLYSHYNTRSTFPHPGDEGLQAADNFYGSVAAMLIHISKSQNRL